MSWDVLILNADGAPRSTTEMTDDWQPKTMGDAETVRTEALVAQGFNPS